MQAELKRGSQRRSYWLGLVAIALLYCIYNFGFIYGLARQVPLRSRHVIKFVFILLSFAAGYLSLRRYGPTWMPRLWVGAYITLTGFLFLLGIYDWGVGRVPLGIRVIADDIQELLVSPLLYIALGLLGSLAKE